MTELLSRHFERSAVLGLGLNDLEVTTRDLRTVDRYEFVHGHVPYAAMDHFPDRPFAFTVLRDPVQRAISAFRHLKRDASRMQELAAAGTISPVRGRDYAAAGEMNLGEFLRYEPLAAAEHLGDMQVEFLARPHLERRYRADGRHDVAVSPRDVDLAIERLRGLDAFGITERLQESADLLARALGVATLGDPGTLNVAPDGGPEPLDAKTLDALREFTRHDSRLYACAAELFAQRCVEAASAPPRMASGVAASFTAGGSLPGPGWYDAEFDGRRWFNWTGPGLESSLVLGTPTATCASFGLRVSVLHALTGESLSGLRLFVNGHELSPHVAATEIGHDVLATVPSAALRGRGEPNRVTIRGYRLLRPCDIDPASRDTRLLGIAVHRIAFEAAPERTPPSLE